MDETRGRSYRRGPGVPTTDDKNPLHGDRPDVWGVSIMPEPLAECGDAVEGPAHTRPPVERAEARGEPGAPHAAEEDEHLRYQVPQLSGRPGVEVDSRGPPTQHAVVQPEVAGRDRHKVEARSRRGHCHPQVRTDPVAATVPKPSAR